MLEVEVQASSPFEQQVRECLSRLYDYAFLQEQPIVDALTPNILPAQRVQAFREIVLGAIESLRPDTKMDFRARQARIYNILLLRYIEGHESQEVLQQLALSERQFYREHRRALQALSRILWEHVQAQDTSANAHHLDDLLDPNGTASISVQSEVQRAYSHANIEHTDLNVLLHGIITATRSLAERFSIDIKLAEAKGPQVATLDSGTLRQTVILIMAWVLPRAAQHNVLQLSGTIADNQVRISLRVFGPVDAIEIIPVALKEQELLTNLLEKLEGRLDFATLSDTLLEIDLTIALKKDLILVIDDNPDVVDLFKRYLIGEPYRVLSARNLYEGVQLARDEQPTVVVLDVMLPDQDGWEILQNLKNYPTTKHIPILICSVMDVPELAFSLGASSFLRKPPGRADFLTALTRCRS